MTLVSITEMRQNPSQTNFCKLVELGGWKGTYSTGGNIEIYPRNSINKIERAKTLLNFSVNYVFTVKSNTHKKLPIPSPCSTETFLSEYMDLSGSINKHEMIRLRDMLVCEDFEKVQAAQDKLFKEKDGVFDVLDLFEEAKIKVSLDLLVNMDKRIEVLTCNVASSLHHLFFQ